MTTSGLRARVWTGPAGSGLPAVTAAVRVALAPGMSPMHAPRHMNRSVTLALAVTTSLLIARSAAADTRSWTAVKKVIGKGDTTVA